MAQTGARLAEILSLLAGRGIRCDLFGGWAEEILGLRAPGPHRDIDLVYRAATFRGLDAALPDLGPHIRDVPGKRFAHKRAVLIDGTLCEFLLVAHSETRPVTVFWGDVVFYWDPPLLHHEACSLCGMAVSLVAAHNLRKYRASRRVTEPHRWADPASLVRP